MNEDRITHPNKVMCQVIEFQVNEVSLEIKSSFMRQFPVNPAYASLPHDHIPGKRPTIFKLLQIGVLH